MIKMVNAKLLSKVVFAGSTSYRSSSRNDDCTDKVFVGWLKDGIDFSQLCEVYGGT